MNHCHSLWIIHRTHHKQSSHTKFTLFPTLNAPQVYQEVPISNTGRDKVYTDWMFCAPRLSLQPYATLESSPDSRVLPLPAISGLLTRLVTYTALKFLHVGPHLPRTSNHLCLCISVVSTETANRTGCSIVLGIRVRFAVPTISPRPWMHAANRHSAAASSLILCTSSWTFQTVRWHNFLHRPPNSSALSPLPWTASVQPEWQFVTNRHTGCTHVITDRL